MMQDRLYGSPWNGEQTPLMSDLRWRANHYRNAGILAVLVSWGFLSVQGCRDGSDGESGSMGISTEPVSTWSPRSHEGFVGSQACQRCHETIYEKYQAHPMAHAMSTPDQLVNSIEHQSEGRVFSDPPFLEYDCLLYTSDAADES